MGHRGLLYAISQSIPFLPAIVEEARQQASLGFTGTYSAPPGTNTSSNTNGTSPNLSALTITTDARPGLAASNITSLSGLTLAAILGAPEPSSFSVRLYPTGLRTVARAADGKGTYTKRMSFRATFEVLPRSDGLGACET